MEFRARHSIFIAVAVALTVSCFGQIIKVKNNSNGKSKLTNAEYALLKDSVKYIVGPHAPVTPEILAYAKSQPSIPRNFHEMMGYMPYYFAQARQIGLQKVANAYNEGIENPANIDTIINQRATQWWINNGYVSQRTSDNRFEV